MDLLPQMGLLYIKLQTMQMDFVAKKRTSVGIKYRPWKWIYCHYWGFCRYKNTDHENGFVAMYLGAP